MLIRCKSCFQNYDESFGMCPNCGYVEGEPPAEVFCLAPGTVIADRYIIGGMLGLGGFGITYKAWDKKLDTMLAIKEYYPSGLVNRQPGGSEIMLVATKREREFVYGKTRFLEEARNMAKFSTHKNIVNVFDFFEANNTAYIVMEFLDGKTLSQTIQQQNVPLPYDYCVSVATQVCAALKAIHKENILHRDVSPDNIMICNDGNVKLFDFGAARFSAGVENRVTVVVKPGFAPPEQYDKVNRQDPRTDIYALGATLYYAMTGIKPEESTNRKIEDTLLPPAAVDSNIPENISNAVMRAMAVEQQYRFASVDTFESALSSGKKVASVQKERAKRWRRRTIGICTSFLIIVGVAVVVALMLKGQKDARTLPDAELCLWYIQTGNGEADERKAAALEGIIENFTEEYKNINIDLIPVAEQDYLAALSAGNDSGEKPSIFESSGLEVSNFAAALPIGPRENTGEYVSSVIDGDNLKLATGIITPIIYVNSAKCSLSATVNFEEIQQQCSDESLTISVGESAAVMYKRYYGANIEPFISSVALDSFLNRSVDVYMGTSSDYFDVQAAMPGEYSVIIPDGEIQTLEYASQWSISNLDSDDLKVAEAFLTYLVSPLAQDYFHIKNQSGELPITKSALDEYVNIYGELQGIVDFLSRPNVAVDTLEPIEEPIAELDSVEYNIQRMDMSVSNSNGEKMADLYYDLVVLSGSGEGVTKINQALDTDYQEYKTNNQAITAESLSEAFDLPYFDTYSTAVTHNDSGIFSVIFTADWFWGGVHNINYYGKTFDLNSGEALSIRNLIDAEDSVISAYLKETAKQYIRNSGDRYFMEDAEKTVEAYELDTFPFYIEDKQIILCFETYELASGADGPIIIPTGLFLGQEKPSDLTQLLTSSETSGSWTWYDDEFSTSRGVDLLLGEFHFNQDMTCTMGYGYYQSEYLGGASGAYSLNGNTIVMDLVDDQSSETYHYEFQVEPVGGGIAFTQISESGPFYFHTIGTVLVLQPGTM